MIQNSFRFVLSYVLAMVPVAPVSAVTTVALSVNFQSDPVHVIPESASNRAGVVSSAFWNNSDAGGLSSAILSDRSSHPISVSISTSAAHTQIASPASNDERLMGGSFDLHGGTFTLNVSGLPADFSSAGYDIYLYQWGIDNPRQAGLYEVALNGSTVAFFEQDLPAFGGFDNSGQATTAAAAGPANDVKIGGVGIGEDSFEVTVDNIDPFGPEAWVVINGIQVVAVPEPGTTAALTMNAIMLAFHRRR